MLSLLLRAQDEETGERMSDQQIHDEVMTLLLAGHVHDSQHALVDMVSALPAPRGGTPLPSGTCSRVGPAHSNRSGPPPIELYTDGD